MKAKRKKSNKQKSTAEPVSPERQKLAAQMVSMDKVFYFVWFLQLVVWNFWKFDLVNNWSGIHTEGWAISDDIYLGLNGVASLVGVWMFFSGKREYKRKPSIETIIKSTRRLIIILSLMLAVFFATFLYGLGVTYKVGQYLLVKAPSIGSTISNIGSTLLSWVVSGVIGNFVYDILKKKYLNKIKASQEDD